MDVKKEIIFIPAKGSGVVDVRTGSLPAPYSNDLLSDYASQPSPFILDDKNQLIDLSKVGKLAQTLLWNEITNTEQNPNKVDIVVPIATTEEPRRLIASLHSILSSVISSEVKIHLALIFNGELKDGNTVIESVKGFLSDFYGLNLSRASNVKCQLFSSPEPMVHTAQNENVSVSIAYEIFPSASRAKNIGFDLTKGEVGDKSDLVIFLDCDVALKPTAIAEVINLVNKEKEKGKEYILISGTPVKCDANDASKAKVRRLNGKVMGGMMLCSRNIFDDFRFPEIVGEDSALKLWMKFKHGATALQAERSFWYYFDRSLKEDQFKVEVRKRRGALQLFHVWGNSVVTSDNDTLKKFIDDQYNISISKRFNKYKNQGFSLKEIAKHEAYFFLGLIDFMSNYKNSTWEQLQSTKSARERSPLPEIESSVKFVDFFVQRAKKCLSELSNSIPFYKLAPLVLYSYFNSTNIPLKLLEQISLSSKK